MATAHEKTFSEVMSARFIVVFVTCLFVCQTGANNGCRVASYKTFNGVQDTCRIKFAYNSVPPAWISRMNFVESFKNATDDQLNALSEEVCRCRLLRVHRTCSNELYEMMKDLAWRCFPGRAGEAMKRDMARTVDKHKAAQRPKGADNVVNAVSGATTSDHSPAENNGKEETERISIQSGTPATEQILIESDTATTEGMSIESRTPLTKEAMLSVSGSPSTEAIFTESDISSTDYNVITTSRVIVSDTQPTYDTTVNFSSSIGSETLPADQKITESIGEETEFDIPLAEEISPESEMLTTDNNIIERNSSLQVEDFAFETESRLTDNNVLNTTNNGTDSEITRPDYNIVSGNNDGENNDNEYQEMETKSETPSVDGNLAESNTTVEISETATENVSHLENAQPNTYNEETEPEDKEEEPIRFEEHSEENVEEYENNAEQ